MAFMFTLGSLIHISKTFTPYIFTRGQINRILKVVDSLTPTSEMNYLSIEGIKELLATPYMTLKHERRDLAVIALLYDTGARVQEIAELKVGDLRITNLTTIKLTGKWNKARIIPLMHSKGMHLLQGNVNLIYIRDFLGHVS